MKKISKKAKYKHLILAIIIIILFLILAISFIASIIAGLEQPAISPEKIEITIDEVIF